MLTLSEIPGELRCPCCDVYIKDVSLEEGFEILTAQVLQAKVAASRTPGYDVYDSELFPNVTFQVKFSNARERPSITKIVQGREATWSQAPTWSWSETIALGADFYILYGVKDILVYPFVVPVYLWESESYDTGSGGRILTISTDQYSQCGRYRSATKRNKFWQYLIANWPYGLLDRLNYYRTHEPMEQGIMCAV